MKKVYIKNDYPSKINKLFNCTFFSNISKRGNSIIICINLLLTAYLFIQIKRINFLIDETLRTSNKPMKDLFSRAQIYNQSKIDIDMIGLEYPKIMFDKIKNDCINGNIIPSFYNFLSQLEIKLIYLEKEINATKLTAFYNSRINFLEKNNVKYDDSKIIYFHNIISWLVIHKSTQLKGIASDKYLACQYTLMKLNKNLCAHRIGVYNSVDEIDFKQLIKKGNVVLKVSNGCHDNVYIYENHTERDISNIKSSITFHFNREYNLMVPEFFHLYSKKRIILEKIFIPLDDLYEFKFMIFNNKIKMCILCYRKNKKLFLAYYDENFISIKNDGKSNFNINIFQKRLLNELKTIAIKLSEDFPNFIRVDLYSFHNNIYLSELTFDSNSGLPAFNDIEYFVNGVKNWKRIDY